jgi:diguanylate cyclase (GGDEF)-like protein/PAS domain S-box-containing protein
MATLGGRTATGKIKTKRRASGSVRAARPAPAHARLQPDDDGMRRLNELLADWYWEQDRNLRLTFLSSRLGDNPGYDLAAYLGRERANQPALNLTQPEWDRHREHLRRHEPFREFEIQCLADDGRAVWMSLSAEPVFDKAGRFQGYRGVGRDVTALKRAGQLLALEHAVTRCLAEAPGASEGVVAALRAICETEGWDLAQLWRFDERTGLLRQSERWSAPGVDPGSDLPARPGVGLLGSAWQSQQPLWVADAAQDSRAERELSGAAGLRAVVLFPVRYSGRIIGVLQLGCRGVRAPEQGVLDALGVIGNQLGQFLQRAAAEQAVRQSEARFRSLTNLSFHWYWELDTNYCFTRLEGRNVAGGDKDLQRRLIGIRRWESGLEVEGGWEQHRAVLDARKPFHDLLMWRRSPDGSVRYISVSGEPVFSADGSFTGYHGVGRDVTAQKRAEQMLKLEHEVASALASAKDIAAGMKAVIRAVCEAEGWNAGRYYVVDEASGGLRFQDGWCFSETRTEQFIERLRSVWQSGRPVSSHDAGQDAVARPAESEASQEVFAFALTAAGRNVGVLAFSGPALRAPDQRLQQASRMIGNQAGQFLLRKQFEESLREGEERFRSLTQMSSDFFWESDEQHRMTRIVHGPNYAAAEIEHKIIGHRPWDIPAVSPDAAGWAAHRAMLESHVAFRDFEFARTGSDGAVRHYSISGEPRHAADGRFVGYRGVGRDVTEIALARERIALLAYKDPLTGLENRTSLTPALEQAVQRARRHGTKLAGLFIDLDGFKQINDRYGHDAGDRFLVEVARRIRSNIRASDMVARLGGDEFFVLLDDVRDGRTVEPVAQKLLDGLLQPYELEGAGSVRVSASVGVSVFPEDAADAAALIKNSDKAMYAAKDAGKSGYRFFESERPASGAGAAPPPALALAAARTTRSSPAGR